MSNVLNLTFDFFPAVSKFDSKTLKKYNSSLSDDRKACYAGHYEVYRSIINNGYRNALILEDDVDIELNITSIVHGIYPTLPPNWDLLYVGHCWFENKEPCDNKTTSAFRLYYSKMPVCTHAYAVSFAAAQRLVKMLTFLTEPIDVQLINWIKAGFLKSFSIDPPAIVQRQAKDDQTDIPSSGKSFKFYLKNSTLDFLDHKKTN
ncbi:12687_t:CDS:1 [Acaulospora colombiana]|uniref:12687_t:CDS:1 n=1 Tax=Acaulospora colombiana TaxID=27376 RepID=A0ACA9N6R2_9GLOM|nr:12687_t:CDS:1 [Acaulospora colombiana]